MTSAPAQHTYGFDTAEEAVAGYAHPWALVDVETSGLRAGQHRVLSIAVITVDADGRQTREFSTLLDPGVDPGPVHVHGLTAERLRGAPAFEQVAGRIAELLDGRVMVAHNAQFDYDFLSHEFALARSWLPVSQRLCTLALNRRIDTPTEDLRLGTLAAHYGVEQRHAHDALDDTRVLAGVLRGSLVEARRLGVPLPLVACPPRRTSEFRPRIPKTPCAYRNPGRPAPGGPLVQGMKVAITGETATAREELVARAVAAGLNVVGSVSRHTSVLVTNTDGSGQPSAKARRAAAEGVPVLDETAFLALLADVRPGERHEAAGTAAVPAPAQVPAVEVAATVATEVVVAEAVLPAEPAAPTAAEVTTAPDAPTLPDAPSAPVAVRPAARRGAVRERRALTGRRVLVLGGRHVEAVAARTAVVGLGGAAAVNLSANVTDVLTLTGATGDRRMKRIEWLGLPVHDDGWLRTLEQTPTAAADERPADPATPVLPRGGVIDLPIATDGARWTVHASWGQQTTCEVDVVAFSLDEDEQVSCDEDFVFYGAPESPDGTVRLAFDGPQEQAVAVDLGPLGGAVRKIVVAAAIDGSATFGDVGAVEITLAAGDGARPIVQATLDAATTERTLLLGEIYRRGGSWRFRAVGQGFDHGLDALARGYGVDIAE
ncbi:DEDDh family exonuclease [Kitasatospora sp. CM 4170]|uniref:DEDDh family exonuclease n=1 Tax=Kitasatospora aburaviensis TaxID=67265 RepID=A0ABW1F8G8_9ACTN|nr:DEDDh family exonuclease [Kitasatospora sp. CM 4170]WNM44571.1 DEDDh family exonuclease [Kitasatospora sp. CM 4170]